MSHKGQWLSTKPQVYTAQPDYLTEKSAPTFDIALNFKL